MEHSSSDASGPPPVPAAGPGQDGQSHAVRTDTPPADRSATTVLVAALGAGIGGFGFVAAVGGIVAQARFLGAGLPSELSASLSDRGLDFAIGIEVLAVALVVALMVVAAVHWWPRRGVGGSNRQVDDEGQSQRTQRRWLQVLRGLARRARCKWQRLRGLLMKQRWRLFQAVVAGLMIIDYLVWAEGETGADAQFWTFIVVLVVAFVGSYGAMRFAKLARKRRRRRTAGEGIALLGLFAVAAVLGAAAAVAGNLSDPRLRPAALLLTGPPEVVCGLYVAQTSDHVYVGEAVPQLGNNDLGDHSHGSVVEIQRSRVITLVIGSSRTFADALDSADQLGQDLTAGNDVPTLGCAPLGITVVAPPKHPAEPGSVGLRVTRVSPSSAGANAGLALGDTILKVDGHSADRVGLLRAIVAKHAAGDEVKLTVRRARGHCVVVTPTVPSWPPNVHIPETGVRPRAVPCS